ncbi:MAG: hypothetical protein M0R80_24685 [Proteobacteria bacterium]|jgi:hypothetical protein|nr:hypothetical protein [Pseudomonadota bacterium]
MTRPLTKIVAAAALASALLAAATCRSDELGDAEVTARIARIQRNLDDGKVLANVWWIGWIGVQAGSAAGFGALAIADRESPDMPVNAVSAGVSAIGATMLLALPFVPAYAPRRLRALPEDTPEARRAKLAAAEEWLRRSAETEALGRGWIAHLLNFGVAAAAGLLLAFAFDTTDWEDGLYNFGILFVTSELQVATQPTRAIRDWNAYRRLYGQAPRADRFEITAFAAPGAAAVSLRF